MLKLELKVDKPMPKSCVGGGSFCWFTEPACPFTNICSVYKKAYNDKFVELNGWEPGSMDGYGRLPRHPMVGFESRLEGCPLKEE